MLGFITNVRGWVGWSALILIAAAIALAEFLGGIPVIKKALWVFAAVVATVAAFNELRSK